MMMVVLVYGQSSTMAVVLPTVLTQLMSYSILQNLTLEMDARTTLMAQIKQGKEEIEY